MHKGRGRKHSDSKAVHPAEELMEHHQHSEALPSSAQMELRYNEVERARSIYERYVQCLPTVKAWVRYAKFEMQNGEVALARQCYERAVEELGEDGETVNILFILHESVAPFNSSNG